MVGAEHLPSTGASPMIELLLECSIFVLYRYPSLTKNSGHSLMKENAKETGDHWPRAIILVDMNAFFCGVEQADHPEWQGRPIGITNGEQGTCIITSSYEARAYGVRTGMRVREAKAICPGFIQIPSRPERYAEVSTNIMHALTDITPDVEVFSVDEAFLDISHCRRLLGAPPRVARLVKQTVQEASGGVLCSVGVSGDKTTANTPPNCTSQTGSRSSRHSRRRRRWRR